MTWIITACGQVMDMRTPQPAAVMAGDIAHHLAQLNRFTGAAARPYSVAEHSLLVLEIVDRCFQLDIHGRLVALMHDAHEAYIQDITTPAKAEIEGWRTFEGRFERIVRTAFALHTAAHEHAEAVRMADLIALATERAQLLPPGGPQWEVLQGVEPVGWIDLMDRGRVGMSWLDWRKAWLDTYESLDYARNLTVFPVAQH